MPFLPTIGPLERALALRSLPLLGGLRGPEAAALAQLMRERYVRRGTALQRADELVRAVTVVSEGRVRRERDGRRLGEIEAPHAAGLVECLAGAAAQATSSAATNAVVLSIDGAALLDVLEEHFALLVHLRDALGGRIAALQRELGAYEVLSVPAREAPAAAPRLDLVQRLLWPQHAPVLGGFGVAVHAALLQPEGEVRLGAGEALCRVGEPAGTVAVVVDGQVACAPPAPHPGFKTGAGALIGLDAVLSGTPYAYDATAATPVVAIPIRADVFWDVAEDHFHVALAALQACARRLLALETRRDALPASDAAPAPPMEEPCATPSCP